MFLNVILGLRNFGFLRIIEAGTASTDGLYHIHNKATTSYYSTFTFFLSIKFQSTSE